MHLELTQALTLNTMCGYIIALALSNDWMSKTKNGLFSGLVLLKRPPWSVLPLEAMLISVDYAAAPGCGEAREPCRCL